MALETFKFELTEFDKLTIDQQFVNVANAIDQMETQTGGLDAETIWRQAWAVIDHLKEVPRPEITVQRMFSYIVDHLETGERTKQQREQTAYCILFCVSYILCANDEEPDPNQDIIDSISAVLAHMPNIARLFNAVEERENEQEAKGYKVEARNVLAKPKVESAEQAAERIKAELEKDIITHIISSGFVQPSYMAEFKKIWNDILQDDGLLDKMRLPQFGKEYNLKMVTNILALMYKKGVLNASNLKLNQTLFTDKTHYKYFTTNTGDNFSAFKNDGELSVVKQIIAQHKK